MNLLIMLLMWPESYLLLCQFIFYTNVQIVLICDFLEGYSIYGLRFLLSFLAGLDVNSKNHIHCLVNL